MSSLFGCRDISKNKAISMNTANQSDAELRQLIIQKGDSCAYDKLSVQYLDYGYQDFLFCSPSPRPGSGPASPPRESHPPGNT